MKTPFTLFTILLCAASLSIHAQKLLPLEVVNELSPTSPEVIPPESYRVVATFTQDRNDDLEALAPTDSTELFYDEHNNLTEKIYRIWDNSQWPLSSRILYNYDVHHQVLSTTEESWDGSSWINDNGDNRIVREYNENGALTLFHYLAWQDGEWLDYARFDLVYDPATGNLQEETYQLAYEWGQLENVSRYRYTDYDEHGNVLIGIAETWDNNDWRIDNRETSQYNENNLQTQLIVEDFDGTTWSYRSRWMYTYMEGLVDSVIREDWSFNNDSWKLHDKEQYYYDANGHLTLRQKWSWNDDLSVWINNAQSIFEYNADDLLIINRFQFWDEPSAMWINADQQLFTYDENSNRSTNERQFWDEMLLQWVSQSHIKYYYEVFVNTREVQILDQSAATAAPNPSKGAIQLRLNKEYFDRAEVQIQVLNLLGQTMMRCIATFVSQPLQLHLEALPPGTYLLQLRQADKMLTKKVIISR